MSDRSKIEWCDTTWNPITGCTKISQGCKNCYAADLHNRRHAAYLRGAKLPQQYAKPFETVQLHPDRLVMPLHWKKPRRIFVNSTSDLFHEDVPDEFIWKVFSVMAAAENHTFLILTKRPERMDDYLCQWECNFPVLYQTDTILHSWPLPNVWLGVSVEDQAAADERIPFLLATPSSVRFVSCEPLLGPVDIRQYLQPTGEELIEINDAQREFPGKITKNEIKRSFPKLDWVITGGESGQNARPMHPDWARSLRDQCSQAGVPYFFKQWGEWKPFDGAYYPNQKFAYLTKEGHDSVLTKKKSTTTMIRCGKTNAGRLLDGRVWNEFPGGGEE